MLDFERLDRAWQTARDNLMSERSAGGQWVGQLSDSALSTATAVSALSLVRRHGHPSFYELDPQRLDSLIENGLRYISDSQNDDGGWGDTDRSYSNIATTMLGIAAIHLAGTDHRFNQAIQRAESYVRSRGGIAGLRARYGKDKTFAVPILANFALAGLVEWREVSPLPFELACVPQRFYRFVRMPVVSYAIPALVAIGQARFHHRPPRFLPWRWVRKAAIGKSLDVLRRMQPASGGYLEATPLTSFVVMSLAAIDRADHPVTLDGVRFLVDSVRPNGSWPIDTNLATWVTTLSINALSAGGEDVATLGCLDWLLSCQHRATHPFTGAPPGGWGWTDLSGAVPDADDTPGALLALAAWRDAGSCSAADRQRIESAAADGVDWLLGLQNHDGGWPTFCRGWGQFPFDRSGADLTAHVLRSLSVWHDLPMVAGARRAIARGFEFLARTQRADGSWVPLWFGNQDCDEEQNPIYGTAKVLLAYRDCERSDTHQFARGTEFLINTQNSDGGWGGGPSITARGGNRASSIEETALAVEALSTASTEPVKAAVERGAMLLIEAIEADTYRTAWPIGFYFAKLWYYERLYPQIFTAHALGSVRSITQP